MSSRDPSPWYLPDEIAARIEHYAPEMGAVRHDIHQHPELGFEEHRTQGVVRAWLEQHGYTTTMSAKTGLVADLRPDLVGKSKTVALRADLDCLPMQEETDLPYRSVHEGRAHKCGHDGHTAVLMGVAAILAERRDRVPGNVRLLFQPAEEGVDGGGARVMVAEGALKQVDEVYALHNWPGYPRGHVHVKAGALMAQTYELRISVLGRGGHGSQPQSCRDPIVAAAHLVCALQTAVSRGLGYSGGAVVSICQFNAGTANNVIPDLVELTGTIRTFAPEVTQRVLQRVREIASGCAMTFGVKIDVQANPGYPVVMNNADCAEAVARVARGLLGEHRVSEAGLPMAGGEDFAYMAEAAPGAYFFIGSGVEGKTTPGCHHPDFDFDNTIIPCAMGMMLGLVNDRLAAQG